MLRVPGEWIWDSWIADDGERYRLFFWAVAGDAPTRSACAATTPTD